MILIATAIPLLTVAALLCFFKEKVTTWEWVILLVVSLIVLSMSYLVALTISQHDTEYYGGYVQELRYYEPWNERVVRTRDVPCGKDMDGHTRYRTETYYKTVWHPQRFAILTNLHEYEVSISKDVFEVYKRRFSTMGVFVDMHRHYYTEDGDAYYYFWDNDRNTFISYTESHIYRNHLKNSNSLFAQADISEDSARMIGLFDYPNISPDTYYQPTILGIYITDSEKESFDFLNGYYGKKYQFRIFFLAYTKGQGMEVSEQQKCYWQGGNKNELVVCVGVDSNRRVSWSNAFSWCDEPWIEAGTRQWFSKHDSLDLVEYCNFLEENIPEKWRRKEFSDFSYIHPTLPVGWGIGIVAVVAVFCLVFAVFVVRNDNIRAG